jgi:hypothetical protein
MKLTDKRIAEIKAAEAAATDGPWEASDEYILQVSNRRTVGLCHDAAFIALARTAVPDLLTDREALTAEIETMRDACARLVTDAIGSMERPRIFGFGHTRKEVAAVDADDIIRALKDVVEIKVDATLTDQED